MVWTAVGLVGVAAAQAPVADQYAEGTAEISVLGARAQEQEAATGFGTGQRAYELRIARDDTVSHSRAKSDRSPRQCTGSCTESPPRSTGSERTDTYSLARGKAESYHGANTGPSRAGAMGPMQFLPLAWETSGVDGNGVANINGVAKIMDPRDAIPAAARYLKMGGARGLVQGALLLEPYNHAD